MPLQFDLYVAGRHVPRIDHELTDVSPNSVGLRFDSGNHQKFWLDLRITRETAVAMLAAMDAETEAAKVAADIPY